MLHFVHTQVEDLDVFELFRDERKVSLTYVIYLLVFDLYTLLKLLFIHMQLQGLSKLRLCHRLDSRVDCSFVCCFLLDEIGFLWKILAHSQQTRMLQLLAGMDVLFQNRILKDHESFGKLTLLFKIDLVKDRFCLYAYVNILSGFGLRHFINFPEGLCKSILACFKHLVWYVYASETF